MSANKLARAIQQTIANKAKNVPRVQKLDLSKAFDTIRNGAGESTGMPNKINQTVGPVVNQIQPSAPKPISQDKEEKEEQDENLEIPTSLGISRNEQFEIPSEDAKEGASSFADKVKGFVSSIGSGVSGLSRDDQFKTPSEDTVNTIKSGMDSFMSTYAQTAKPTKNDSWEEPSDKAREAIGDAVNAVGGFMKSYGESGVTPTRTDLYEAPDAATAERISSKANDALSTVNDFMRSYGETNPTFSRNDSNVLFSNGKTPTTDYSWMDTFSEMPDISREQNDLALSNGKIVRDEFSDGLVKLASDPANLAENLFGTGGVLDPGRKVTVDREGIHRESGDETRAREQEQDEQSRGKTRQNLMNDPEREEYISAYKELFKNEPQYDRGSKDPWEILRDDRFDNGSGNTESHVTNVMSGEQYIKYRQAGIPGRPIEEINPDGTYSKIDEYHNHGFIPYVPDKEAFNNMMLQQVEAGPTKVFNEMRDVREEMFPYEATINGKTINSSNYDPQKANVYLRKAQDELNAEDPESSWFDPEANHEGMTAYTPSSYAVKFPDGSTEEFPGGGYSIIKRPTYNFDENGNKYIVDPSVVVEFRDGSAIQFDDEDDYHASLSVTGHRPAEENEETVYWVPDFVTDDGTRLNYSEMLSLATDDDPEDTSDGITYDMNLGGLGTPRNMLKGITEGGNLGANFWDIAASSAPYFFGPTAWSSAGSNASIALSGNAPMETDEYGVGSQVAENIRPDQYLSNIGFNFAMPATERLAGNIVGKNPLIKVEPFIRRKFGGTAAEPLALSAANVLGEGAEEIVGNAFEDAANNGLLGWYANDAVDENGNPLYDRTGHVVKDLSTSLPNRVSNYADDAPEAFVGGALLGGAFRAPQIVRSDIPETLRRMNYNRNLRKIGLKPFKQSANENAEFVLPDDLVARYTREGGE